MGFAGAAMVIYGAGSLPTDIDTDAPVISPSGTTAIYGGVGDRLGTKFGIGDLDGNGKDDLIIATFRSNMYVLFDFPTNKSVINVKDYRPKLTVKLQDDLGESLTVADVNGDGFADMLAGSAYEEVGQWRSGSAFIIYGSGNPPAVLDMSKEKDRAFTTQILPYQERQSLGNAIATGDINGDGIDDIVVSGPATRTISGNSSGEVYVIYGRSKQNSPPMVEKSQILQNFPNPFNANTVIRYRLERAQYVRLTIYNALGKEVRRLVDGKMEAGEHRAIWNGYDANFKQVGSGVYFCRIIGEAFSESIKLLYLK